jgi:CDP-2,3-bis-(O-geranylgeranyl)-sn-glycerol synthase
MKELFFVFWFFVPAGLANVAAFFSGKIPFLKRFSYPVDLGYKIKGKRILGSHKTIRGFVAGIIVAILASYIQILFYQYIPFLRTILPIDYSHLNPILFGTLAGFGALAGDAIKSFFKRQVNVQPGKSWIPFDQIDYIVGGIVFTAFYIQLTLIDYFWLFLVWFLIHPLTTFLGFLVRLKKEPL